MQGYLSSEPYLIEKEGGFVPEVFLIADAGYSTYATTVETMADTIEQKPEEVECFVNGSILGWYNFLYGDNSAARELIVSDNPSTSLAHIRRSSSVKASARNWHSNSTLRPHFG